MGTYHPKRKYGQFHAGRCECSPSLGSGGSSRYQPADPSHRRCRPRSHRSAATSSTPVYVPTTTAAATSAPAGYVSLPTEVAAVEPSTSTSAVPTAPTIPVATITGAGSESGNENPWSGSGWEQPSQGHPWWAGNSWWRQRAESRS
jgi:hypothetical protein